MHLFRVVILVFCFLGASALPAQVFAQITAESAAQAIAQARRRIAEQQQTPPQPEIDPEQAKRDALRVKFDTAMKRFKEEQDNSRSFAYKVANRTHPDPRKYLQASYLAAVEDFDQCERSMRDVKVVTSIPEESPKARREMLSSLRQGAAVFDGIRAGVQQRFSLAAPSRAGLLMTFDSARRDAEKKLQRFEANVPAAYDLEGVKKEAERLRLWLDASREAWGELYDAWQAMQATPWDAQRCYDFGALAVTNGHIPLIIHGRMALAFVIAEFPDHPTRMSGEAAMKLALGWRATWEFDKARQVLTDAQGYCNDEHPDQRRRYLNALEAAIEDLDRAREEFESEIMAKGR